MARTRRTSDASRDAFSLWPVSRDDELGIRVALEDSIRRVYEHQVSLFGAQIGQDGDPRTSRFGPAWALGEPGQPIEPLDVDAVRDNGHSAGTEPIACYELVRDRLAVGYDRMRIPITPSLDAPLCGAAHRPLIATAAKHSWYARQAGQR